MNIDERVLARLPAKLAQSFLSLAGQAAEYGVAVSLTVSIAVSRAQAGRLGGQRSAITRAERYGTAQPTAPPEAKGVLPRSKLEANAEANELCSEANSKQTPEANTVCIEANSKQNGEVALPPPLGSPSLNQGSFTDLLQIASLLASSKELKASARARTKGEAKPTWRRVPGEWEPTPEHVKIATAMNVDLQLEASKFRDHEFQKPKRDAHATFRNWLRAAKPSPRPIGLQSTNGAARKHATPEDVKAMLGLK